MNYWITFVKAWALKNNMSYKDAIKDTRCKSAYHSTFKKAGGKGNLIGGNLIGDLARNAKAMIFGREDYPPKVREFLNNYGNDIIVSATLRRVPIRNTILQALNFVSLGSFGHRLDKSDYDKLFHLQFIITTNRGTRVAIEKEEVIKININPQERDNEEYSEVHLSHEITIQQLLNNTKDYMRKSMFSYSAKDNNCQDFVMGILNGNDIGSEENRHFAKQDTEDLFSDNNFLRKFSNTVTDLGARADVLQNGAGIKMKAKKY